MLCFSKRLLIPSYTAGSLEPGSPECAAEPPECAPAGPPECRGSRGDAIEPVEFGRSCHQPVSSAPCRSRARTRGRTFSEPASASLALPCLRLEFGVLTCEPRLACDPRDPPLLSASLNGRAALRPKRSVREPRSEAGRRSTSEGGGGTGAPSSGVRAAACAAGLARWRLGVCLLPPPHVPFLLLLLLGLPTAIGAAV